MTSLFSFLVLFFCSLVWLALPLLPAFNEWRRKTDVMPLRVVREYDGNVQFFARGFRDYVTNQIDALPDVWETREANNEYSNDAFSDGSAFCVLRGNHFPVFESEIADRAVQKIVLACAAVDLPPNLVFAKEVFAYQSLRAGNNSVFRAILGDADLVLGANTSVLRWLHCEGRGIIGDSSTLYGRASSANLLIIGNNCVFQRLNAPRIIFGSEAELPHSNIVTNSAMQTWKPEDAREQAPKHYFVRGDLRIPAGVRLEGNVVTTGTLHIEAGASVDGSTKSHGDTVLENGSRVYGSVVSAKKLTLKENSYVRGPLIAEDDVAIGKGCRLGDEKNPTTISAPNIEVHTSVIVFGTVWAREAGKVVAGGV